MAGPPLLPVMGNRGARPVNEEERFLECPICLIPMDAIVFLGTMPDDPSQKWTACRHGFCASCVRKGLAKAAQANSIPTCAICRREIVSIIEGAEPIQRLLQEFHKFQDLKKDAEGWQGIIATLNAQLKKTREEAKRVAQDADKLAAADREKAGFLDEILKLRIELGEMAKSVEVAEARRKEKEDLAKHALADLQVARDKEREDTRLRIEEVKDAYARQMLVKDRLHIQKMEEAAAAHAHATHALTQEVNALKAAVAQAQQGAARDMERQVADLTRQVADLTKALTAEREAASNAAQRAQEEKAAGQRAIQALNTQVTDLQQKLDAERAKVDAEKAQTAQEVKRHQLMLKEAEDAKAAELKRLTEQMGALNVSLSQARNSQASALQEVEAKAKEREMELRRKLEAMQIEKLAVEGKLTNLSRRAEQVASMEKKAEEIQIAESALRQQLIDKSNQIFSLEQHNAALQTHIKELKGRIARMDGGSASRVLSPPPSGSNLSSSSLSSSHVSAPAQNNSYLGMLSSSLSNTVASVSAAPLTSWWSSGSTKRGGFIKTSADYHKFVSQDERKHTSLARFSLPTCRGQDIAGGSHVFICRVRVAKSAPSIALYREMMYTSTLRHQNILRLDGVIREKLTENDFLLELALTPFVEESLEDAIRSLRFSPAARRGDRTSALLIPEQDIRSMFHQLLSMVHYLHSAGLVLRTFNPSQVLFSPRECVIKLGLPSSVRSMYSQPFDPLPPSALFYIAPELLYTSAGSPQVNWRAADCWSVGCVLAEILLGRPLFDGCKDSIAVLRRALSIPSLRPKTIDDVVLAQLPVIAASHDSPSFLPALPAVQLVEILPDAGAAEIDLIARLMCLVPQYRITIKQALDHACFPAGQFAGAVESGLGAELADDQIMKWVENVGLFK